ncbi:MAG TPA: hypothetical protein DE312_10370 [Gallionella sp.]|jgi:hypothetical protein|nr:hypothetical protein [Gallionella sp.]OGS66921.1 MAG: hypothetical protein A2Z87_01560 [Gallionellales bacterium GWA2_54_124]OGT20575.1 MAG: hypothetical protein A2522_01640 [Gallionellales bacterium RIFOXYD12_FULL_53_10]HCI53699.1 hypothetical protein [Gallionella sp.]
MLTLPLEPTDDRADPIFKDAVGCATWLNQLQLTNLQQAHGRLLKELCELNRYPMRGQDRLDILELLQETAGFIQTDLAKKLVDKALPLNDAELLTFKSLLHLWQAMIAGYQRGLQSFISGEKQLAGHGALLCQRCLHFTGLEILEYLRTGYECPPGLWHQLHELYAYAEQQEFQHTETDAQSSCTASYIKTLLVCYADPAQLTRWQLQQIDIWLSLWSNTFTIANHYATSVNDAPPLAIDLSGSQGLQSTTEISSHASMRYLPMVPLSKLLRVKIILLQQGQTPLQIGLGNQSDRHACLELLSLVHQNCCEKKHLRACVRRPANLPTAVFGEPARIFQTNLFGADTQPTASKPENWQMKDESIMGACLIRTDADGAKLKRWQLIALRTAHHAALAATVWIRVMQDGRLQTGVRYFPGRPEPIRIRAVNQSIPAEYAFLLPALPALKTPASLILPRNWFEAGRVIVLMHQDGRILQATLGFSVEQGFNFERVSFTLKN